MTIRVRIEHADPTYPKPLQVDIRYTDHSAPGVLRTIEPGQAIEEYVWGNKQLVIREVPQL